MNDEQNKVAKEQRALIYRAVSENIQRNKWLNQPSKVQELILYVAECEMWGQDTISPSDEYLVSKLHWNPNTNVRNIRYQAKRTQFITTTGRGKNLRYELNQGFLRGKIGELLARKRPSLDMSEFLLLDKTIDKVLDNPLDKKIDIPHVENGLIEPPNDQNDWDNSISSNSNISENGFSESYTIEKETEERQSKPDRRVKEKLEVFRLFGSPQAWWKSTPQRTAALALLDAYKFDQVSKAVLLAKSNKDDPFCPKINTPVQLVEKWGALLDYRNRNL